MIKVLVIGGSGMLGKDVVRHFAKDPLNIIHSVQRTFESNFFPESIIVDCIDILNTQEFADYLKKVSPNLIINCAANVDLEFCESNPDAAFLLNADVIKVIHDSVPSAKFIYISTDSVFDGIKGGYTELSEVNMLNKYAESKFKGEQYALSLYPDAIVIRTNIYGFHFDPKRSSLAEWAIDNFRRNESISGFYDVFFNPVYTKQLAVICEQLVKINFSGIINVGADRNINKYEFLKELGAHFEYDTKLLKQKSIHEIEFKAKRPVNTTLDTTLLKHLLGYSPVLSQGMYSFANDFKQLIK